MCQSWDVMLLLHSAHMSVAQREPAVNMDGAAATRADGCGVARWHAGDTPHRD